MKASYYLNKRHILTFVIFSPFQISILVSSLIDGNIGSFIFNLALLALSLYSGLIIISYRYRFMNDLVFIYSNISFIFRKLILDTSYDVKPVQMNLLGDGYKEMAVMGSGSSSEGDSKV